MADLGGGGRMGGMHPPHQPKHNVHMHNIEHLKKSNQRILDRPGDCNIISEAIGGWGRAGRKKLFLQQTFYKAEISFLQVRLI